MKRIIKIIGSIICILLGLIILYEAVKIAQSDPWGLAFMFCTLPMLIFALLFLLEGYYLIRSLKDDKQENEQ